MLLFHEDKTLFQGVLDEVRVGPKAQLSHHVRLVDLHGARDDEKPRGNFGGAAAIDGEMEDLAFPHGKRVVEIEGWSNEGDIRK